MAFRLMVVAVNALALWIAPLDRSNLDWISCALISAVVSVALFGWLSLLNGRRDLDLSEPYSLSAPFWPINTHPLRGWILIAVSLMVSGALASVKLAIMSPARAVVPLNVFSLGASLMLAIFTWLQIFRPRQLSRRTH
jgi:hypothetical protein